MTALVGFNYLSNPTWLLKELISRGEVEAGPISGEERRSVKTAEMA